MPGIIVASGRKLHALAAQLGDHELQAPAQPQLGDDEMVEHLQRRVAQGVPSPGSFIREMNVHSAAPWDIFGEGKEKVWCFSPGAVGKDGGEDGGESCWHQQQGKEEILSRDKKFVVAHKRTLYYSNKIKVQSTAGARLRYRSLGWSMIEIRLNQPDQQLVLCKVYKSRTNSKTTMAPASCAAPDPPKSIRPALAAFKLQTLTAPITHKGTQVVVGQQKAVAEETRPGGDKPAMGPTVVMKFGRSSLASAERIKQVADLLLSFNMETPVVVLSAIGETRDKLLQAGHQAMSCDTQKVSEIDELAVITNFHLSTARELGLQDYIVSDILDSLKRHLKDIARKKNLSPKELDYLHSFGERLSTRILSAHMNERGTKARQYDLLDLGLTTTDKHTDILQAIYSAITEQLVGDWIDEPAMPIVAGSLVKEWESCAVTTFGRGGSDLTAVLIGRALGSREIQIWKDVDGVLTCDPSICANVKPVPTVTFDEAAELLYSGAQVFHPQSTRPAWEGHIPVLVKNLCNPLAPGTLITKTRDMSKSVLTGIALESNASVLHIVRSSKIGQYGFLPKVLPILHSFGISDDYIVINKGKISAALLPSKVSSREWILLGLDEAVKKLQPTADVRILHNRSVVSLIGNTKKSSSISGRAFQALEDIGVDAQMYLSGLPDSEVTKISFVVNDSEAIHCAQTIHAAFFEKEYSGPVSSTAAVLSCIAKKRKAEDDDHLRASLRPDGPKETIPGSSMNSDIMTSQSEEDGVFHMFLHDNLSPITVENYSGLAEEANRAALESIQLRLLSDDHLVHLRGNNGRDQANVGDSVLAELGVDDYLVQPELTVLPEAADEVQGNLNNDEMPID